MSNLSQFTGYIGSKGYTGSVGYTGSAGGDGGVGYTGSKGAPGTSITFKGTVADETALLAVVGMVVNDAWIRTDTGNLYVYNGATWDDAGQIVGPQGDIGYTGSKGDIGYTGSASTEIGYTGSQGVGYSGSKGDIGYTGSQGLESQQAVVVVTGTAVTPAAANTFYILTNITDPTTVTLPAAPTAGDKIGVVNNTGLETCVIARNGKPIMSLGEDLTLNYLNATVRLMFVSDAIGWFIL